MNKTSVTEEQPLTFTSRFTGTNAKLYAGTTFVSNLNDGENTISWPWTTSSYTCVAINSLGAQATSASVSITAVGLPVITAFTVPYTTVNLGDSVTFTTSFTGGTAVLLRDFQQISTSFSTSTYGPITMELPLGTVMYTLRVVNSVGAVTDQNLEIHVVPAPGSYYSDFGADAVNDPPEQFLDTRRAEDIIESFIRSDSSSEYVAAGAQFTLRGFFNGSGRISATPAIDPESMEVFSGVHYTFTTDVSRTYTLTVISTEGPYDSRAGSSVSRSLTIFVGEEPGSGSDADP